MKDSRTVKYNAIISYRVAAQAYIFLLLTLANDISLGLYYISYIISFHSRGPKGIRGKRGR